jgi:hypothetical protein
MNGVRPNGLAHFFGKTARDNIEEIRTARDKVIAHSDYQAMIESVPSFDCMEKLLEFGADFYGVVSQFVYRLWPRRLEKPSRR